MTECSACGAELTAHETRCPICGKPTAYYHRQRRCLHCGAPAAQRAVTCMMCGKPVDSLPLSTSVFSGSWAGIALGVLIIVGLVYGLFYYQSRPAPSTVAAAAPSPTVNRPTRTPTLTPVPTMTDTPMPTATFTPTPTATPITYSVQSGDYPVLIAELYNVPVDELITLNNLEETGLQVGQVLIIPPSAPAATAAAAAGPTPETITYIIESGDTLLGIALEYDTTVEDIAAVNPDTSLDLIFPGQEILVPLAPPTITPTPTIPPTATATPGPAYPSPDLLSPAAGQSVDDDALVFQWTSTTLLAPDEYYVLQLTWANGDRTQAWLKNNGWRITKTQRPANGLITWSVTLMRQTGTHTDGQPTGFSLSFPGEQRPIEWR